MVCKYCRDTLYLHGLLVPRIIECFHKGSMVAERPGGIIRLGTRGSALALRQAEMTAELLRHGVYKAQVEVVVIRTEGDAVQDRPISQFGDKGLRAPSRPRSWTAVWILLFTA
jgi:hypothetical protein